MARPLGFSTALWRARRSPGRNHDRALNGSGLSFVLPDRPIGSSAIIAFTDDRNMIDDLADAWSEFNSHHKRVLFFRRAGIAPQFNCSTLDDYVQVGGVYPCLCMELSSRLLRRLTSSTATSGEIFSCVTAKA